MAKKRHKFQHSVFRTEVFKWYLHVVIYDSSVKANIKSLKNLMKEQGLDSNQRQSVLGMALDSWGLCFDYAHKEIALIAININWRQELNKVNKVHILETLQHECGHFREAVVKRIGEQVRETDTEVYLRLSDWAFRSALTMDFFSKKIIK